MAVRNGTPGPDVLSGTAANDTLSGAVGTDILNGLAGRDTLYGGLDDDRLYGGAGNDRLVGGDSNDFGLYGGSGDDTIDGGSGNDDEVGYDDGGTRGVVADLGAGTATDSHGGHDILIGLERLRGSAFADRLTGSDAANVLTGLGGNDRLFGGDGNEIGLDGGAGNDTIDGGDGNDRVRYRDAETGVVVDLALGTARDGQGGTDRLISVERTEDTAFDDVFRGSAGRNHFRMAFGGNDSVDGRGDQDAVDYGLAAAAIVANLQTGRIASGDGTVDRVASIEEVTGTAFADTIIGTSGNYFERFTGLAGADLIDGGADISETRQEGSAGVDYFDAPAGIVADLRAGRIEDGYGTVDTVRHVNEVSGSFGDDVMRGGANDFYEQFAGRGGDDTIDGRSGYDRVSYDFDGGSGGIVVDLAAGTALDTFGDHDRLLNVEAIIATGLADVARGSDAAFESFRMLGGDNSVDGRGGIDRIDYGRDSAGVSVDLAAGTAVDGGGGHDRLANVESALGSAFADLVVGSRFANQLEGLAGNDRLYGGNGDDRLMGGTGFDVLGGGLGADELWGGGGRDRFVLGTLNEGQDIVHDFDGLDVIDLRPVTQAAFDPGDALAGFVRFVAQAGDTRVQVDADGNGSGFTTMLILGDVVGLGVADLYEDGRLLLG